MKRNSSIKNLIIYAIAIAICSQVCSCINQHESKKISFDVPKAEINTDSIIVNNNIKLK